MAVGLFCFFADNFPAEGVAFVSQEGILVADVGLFGSKILTRENRFISV